MTKTTSQGLFVLVLLCMTYSSFSVARDCDTLTATGNSEYPPYLWRVDTSSDGLQGAISLIMDELGKRINRTIQLKHVGSWSRAQAEVKAGRVDLIAGAFYTIPRNQWMDYVYPAFLNTTSTVWINKKSNFEYFEPNDLTSLLGVTVINNSFGQDFDQFAEKNLNIEQVASLKQAFKMLVLKRVDYALYEKNPGLAYAAELGVERKIKHLEPPVSSEGLYLTVSHKSDCNTGALRGALSRHVRDIINEGFAQEALQKGLLLWNMSRQQ